MAGFLNLLGMLVGSIGIFLGFYHLANHPEESMRVVTLTTVGVVGTLAFVRHVLFHRADAKRMGWETERPDWAFEVGYANLAFGVMGFVAAFLPQGSRSQALILLGYALYLAQASALHGYRYFTETPKSPARLWRSFLATLLYAGMMAFFALRELFRP